MMIAKLTTKILRSPSGREFASISPEDVAFPYIFGRKSTPAPPTTKSLLAVSLMKSRKLEEIVSGTKLAYRAMLEAIRGQDMSALDQMLEKRLFARVKRDSERLKSQGLVFALRNEDAEVKVELNDAYTIIGGDIDRDKELSRNPVLISSPVPGILLYANPNAPDYGTIIKMKFDVCTKLKLDMVRPSTGETLVTEGAAQEEERHEFCLEGLCRPKVGKRRGLFGGAIYEMQLDLRPERFELSDVTIVDFDNALKGNCHKDSNYI